MANVIKGLTPSLKWLSDMLSFFQVETIKVPQDYRSRVIEVKKLLQDDTSGLINSILDFSIDCALVKYSIETDNENLTDSLNLWLKGINGDLRGKIPTGLEALAKEYFRERWKGSSFLVLRTFWSENKDGLILPTTLFFVDGEDIRIKTAGGKNAPVELGDENYAIRIDSDEKKDILIPKQSNEIVYVQKPFESWGTRYPVPYVIRRGLYRNLAFFNLMNQKGELIVGKALEYLLILTKGTERMLLDGHITYDEKDIQKASDDLKALLEKRKHEEGTTSYTSNFDTKFEHLIPDYQKVMNDVIYSPLERRILAGLGMVDIIEGTASTRRESILNPKPLVSEIKQGIKDFKSLLNDIIIEIILKNQGSHPKWMGSEIEISNTPINQFMDDKLRTMLRSLYDRGNLSRRTLVEVVGEMDYDLEVRRRTDEKTKRHNQIMYPPVIQNIEKDPNEGDTTAKQDLKNKKENQNKSGPEAKKYNNAELEIDELEISSEEFIKALDEVQKIFEEAPWSRNADLPEAVRKYPTGAQTIFRQVFNQTLKKHNDETLAFKYAWTALKNYIKSKNTDAN